MLVTSGRGSSGIVTPEAVVLEFETAGMASRLIAATLDAVIELAILVAVLLGFFGLSELGLELGGLATALLYVLLFLLIFGYPAAFETLWRGRTPGKAALGLRVVTVEGGPIRFRHAAIRAMLGLFDKFVFSGIVGIVSLLATRRNQRLGDLVAGTIVLRERTGAKAPNAVTFSPPPGLEGYVASLDAGGLGHGDYAPVRSFLIRATGLAPPARAAVAAQLATPLVERLRTTPPPGLPAEVFLACVAAAYQQRNGGPPSARPTFTSVWADPVGPSRPGMPAPAPMGATSSRVAGASDGFTAPG